MHGGRPKSNASLGKQDRLQIPEPSTFAAESPKVGYQPVVEGWLGWAGSGSPPATAPAGRPASTWGAPFAPGSPSTRAAAIHFARRREPSPRITAGPRRRSASKPWLPRYTRPTCERIAAGAAATSASAFAARGSLSLVPAGGAAILSDGTSSGAATP